MRLLLAILFGLVTGAVGVAIILIMGIDMTGLQSGVLTGSVAISTSLLQSLRESILHKRDWHRKDRH